MGCGGATCKQKLINPALQQTPANKQELEQRSRSYQPVGLCCSRSGRQFATATTSCRPSCRILENFAKPSLTMNSVSVE